MGKGVGRGGCGGQMWRGVNEGCGGEGWGGTGVERVNGEWRGRVGRDRCGEGE